MKQRQPRKVRSLAGTAPIGIPQSPFLTTEEAALYCRFDTAANGIEMFRQWVWRYAVPHSKRGRRLLFRQSTLDAYLDGNNIPHGA
jgi:hypothetical protein